MTFRKLHQKYSPNTRIFARIVKIKYSQRRIAGLFRTCYFLEPIFGPRLRSFFGWHLFVMNVIIFPKKCSKPGSHLSFEFPTRTYRKRGYIKHIHRVSYKNSQEAWLYQTNPSKERFGLKQNFLCI